MCVQPPLGNYFHAVRVGRRWCCRALCRLAYGTLLTAEMSRGAWWACVVACCLARRLFWCTMRVFGEGRVVDVPDVDGVLSALTEVDDDERELMWESMMGSPNSK